MKLLINTTLIFFLVSLNFAALSDSSDNVTTYPGDFKTGTFEDEVYDPIEPFNRAMFGFNNFADKLILEPAAKGYKKLPSPIQTGIGNFLGNLRMPLIILNQFLQGQGSNAIQSTGRFVVNSTAGVFGIIDVADKVGLEAKQEDFATKYHEKYYHMLFA